ncbi:unnamed protein product, partial [Ixodes persulcatus]
MRQRHHGTVTSPWEVIKPQHPATWLRGRHGSNTWSTMPKNLFFIPQISYDSYTKCFKPCSYCLVVLPCPTQCVNCLNECWLKLSLLLGGDIESNPGPDDLKELVQSVLHEQGKLFKEVLEIKNSIRLQEERFNEINTRLDQLDEVVKTTRETGGKLAVLEGTVQELQRALHEQNKKLVDYEDRSRRNNLIVFGLPEQRGETRNDLEQKVIHETFSTKLGVTVSSVERIHRLGRLQEGKSRPVILRLFNYNEKQEVLNNCKKLKNTGLSVSNDYSQSTLSKRKKLWSSVQGDRQDDTRVRLVHDKLFVNGEVYTWDDEKDSRVRLNAARTPPKSGE